MPQALRFRTPISKQANVLRASLLLSLGITPLACGGSVVTVSNESNGGSAHGGASGGTGAVAGMGPSGGTGAVAGMGPSGGTGAVIQCPNPEVSPDTGLVICSNGLTHRDKAIACSSEPAGTAGAGDGGAAGAGGAASAGDGGAAGAVYCDTNADCAGLVRGFCQGGGGELPVCVSGCATDSDCNAGSVCICGDGNPGHCTSGACSVDADCGPDSLCALATSVCGIKFFHCTTPEDQCTSDADCTPAGGDFSTCGVEDGHRACNTWVCGRPFLISEAPRMAAVERRADWLDTTLAAEVGELTPLERAQLAAHWARLGQMEHASIAAFARFNLQLLSLGAPSHLVEACNRALADETAHARSCFALASAYGGTAVGPARLDIDQCFEDTSLAAIAKLVLREGCLGETVAALEAVAAAEVAADPAVKRALERIAHDELNHAELAFQFLRWALSISSPEVRHELAGEAARQLADFESDAQNSERSSTNDRLAAHGLLGSDAIRAIHLAAARDVSRPLLAALFDTEQASTVARA